MPPVCVFPAGVESTRRQGWRVHNRGGEYTNRGGEYTAGVESTPFLAFFLVNVACYIVFIGIWPVTAFFYWNVACYSCFLGIWPVALFSIGL